MQFINDLWQLKKAELAFMAEHYGASTLSSVSVLSACVFTSISPGMMIMNYRYRRAQQRNWEIETHQWFLLFMEFLWKLQSDKS